MFLQPSSSRASFTLLAVAERPRAGRTRRIILVVLLLASASCSKSPAPRESMPTAPPPGVDILVQGAEMPELGPLLDALEEKKAVTIGTWHFWLGKLGAKSAVVSLTEEGPVNATAATVLAIERWRPRVILNQGTSGAHDRRLQVGDIVLGLKNVEFNAFTTQAAGPGSGSALSRVIPSTTKMRIGSLENRVGFSSFPGSPTLAAQALRVKYDKGRVMTGVVGSGHQWNREIDRIEWLRKTYGSDVEDMESAYVAAVAYAFQIPFLSVRIVSDSEFHSPEFLRETGSDCAEFVLDFIRTLTLSAVEPVSSGETVDDLQPSLR